MDQWFALRYRGRQIADVIDMITFPLDNGRQRGATVCARLPNSHEIGMHLSVERALPASASEMQAKIVAAGLPGLILVKPDCALRSNVCPQEASPGAQW